VLLVISNPDGRQSPKSRVFLSSSVTQMVILEQVMMTNGRLKVQLCSFLTSALDRGKSSASRPAHNACVESNWCPLYGGLCGPPSIAIQRLAISRQRSLGNRCHGNESLTGVFHRYKRINALTSYSLFISSKSYKSPMLARDQHFVLD
jgi:hypothetical protein